MESLDIAALAKYINSLCKFIRKPTTGNIIVNEQDLTTLSTKELAKARQKIGMIFQGFNLLKTVTVYENIALPLRLAGIPKVEIEKG